MEVLVMEGPYMLTESEIESHLLENTLAPFHWDKLTTIKIW